MENGIISIGLETPVVYTRGTTFDALLWGHVGNEWDEIPSDILMKTNGVYHASTLFIDRNDCTICSASYVRKFGFNEFHDILHPEDRVKHYKRVDDKTRENYPDLNLKLDLTINPFNNTLDEYPCFKTSAVFFYVTGDIEKITMLLRDLKFIGKKRSGGFGKVKLNEDGTPQINYQIVSGDFVGVVDKNGMAIRPVPIEMQEDFNINPRISSNVIVSWRPNYRYTEKTNCFNIRGNSFMLPRHKIDGMYDRL